MTTYYNDLDPYCCKVLSKNIERGYLPKGYVDGRDIRDVQADELMGYQHIHLFAGIGSFPLAFEREGVPTTLCVFTGGSPCQDISNAGSKQGLDGAKSGLWHEYARLLRESLDCGFRPDYVIVENVEALLSRGMGIVLADLAACGLDAQWQVLPAAAFGAPHLRPRTIIIAYPMRKGLEREGLSIFHPVSLSRPVRRIGLSSSDTLRKRHGVPSYVDRIRGLGNSIDVRVAEYVARCIVDYEMEGEAVA